LSNKEDILIVLPFNYPSELVTVSYSQYKLAQEKNISLYIEYPSFIPNIFSTKNETIYLEVNLANYYHRLVINNYSPEPFNLPYLTILSPQ